MRLVTGAPVACLLALAVIALMIGCGSEKSSEPDTTAPAAVSDLRVESTGCDNVNLAWTAPGDDGTQGKAASYDVRYSSEVLTTGNWASAIQCQTEPAPKTAGATENLAIAGLTSGTTYHFALITRDDEGNDSDLSNGASSSIGSMAIAWVNDGVGADADWATSAASLSANWADAACVDAYEYALGTAQGGTDVIVWTSGGTATQVTRTGLALSEGETYYWSVRGVLGETTGTPVSSDGITVDTGLPTSSVNALSAATSTASFTVSWTGSDALSGLSHYDIQIKEGDGSWQDWLVATTLTSSDLSGVIDHTYSFRSRAYDLAGNVEAYPAAADASTCVTCSFAYSIGWGGDGSGEGEFHYPFGITLDGFGDIYVTETSGRVQKFDPAGQYLLEWGTGGGDSNLSVPTSIAVDDSGYVYVTDTGHDRVKKFTATGELVAVWGSTGDGDGEFGYPRGIAIDDSGYVYVTEQLNDRVQKFTPSGGFVAKWGGFGTGPGQFNDPNGIAVGPSGVIYVAEIGNDRVQAFTSDGTFIATWGQCGTADGLFNNPEFIAVDATGHVYVTDHSNHRIQVFNADGVFLSKWGGFGTGDGQFNHPAGVAVDADGSLFVCDFDNYRVQKFTATCP